MAVKTITIDMQAYTLLSHRKKSGQSFSDVIKAHFGPSPTAGRFRALAKTIQVDAGALDAMDGIVNDRRREPARAVRR